VKWSWIGDHAKVERPIVAVLSARLAPEAVRQFAEQQYVITTHTLEEQLLMAHYTRPLEPPYKAQFETVRRHHHLWPQPVLGSLQGRRRADCE
jgi:hypothetical protein